MGIGNIADTGMQAAMSHMEVISNNIANANTYGFKKSYINFADIYPSLNGSAGNQIGLGVNVANIAQNFSTGGTSSTGQPLDMSLQQKGFFILQDPTSGQTSYTRMGRFMQDTSGYLINVFGQRLQGFAAVNGSVPSGGSVSDIQLTQTSMAASATANATMNVNLDSNSEVPSGTFDPNIATTYNFNPAVKIVDSLGNPHTVVTYYVKTATANTWDVHVYVDGTSVSTGSVDFTTNGSFNSATGLSSISFDPGTGATNPQVFALNIENSTQVAAPSATIGAPTDDGFPPGTFTGIINIDTNGMIQMSYSNGRQQTVGQVAVADFASLDGLSNIGNMQWIATSASGPALVNQSNSLGNIMPGTLEQSNVDLTTEMVNLINAQHVFQANAQVEQVYSEVMQTVIQL